MRAVYARVSFFFFNFANFGVRLFLLLSHSLKLQFLKLRQRIDIRFSDPQYFILDTLSSVSQSISRRCHNFQFGIN